MISSQLENPVQWLAYAASQIDATVKNNILILNGSPDAGSVKLFSLEEGLTMILTDVKSNVEIPQLEIPVQTDYLFMKLYLPDFHLDTTVKSGLERHKILTPGILFYNSQLELKALFNTRERFKIVSFVIHANWLKQTVETGSVFFEKRLFKLPFFKFETLPPAILQSALNLFALKTGTGSLDLRVKAIVYDILSHLFSAFENQTISNLSAAKYQSDIEAIFKVRDELLSTENVIYQTIDVLAKDAAMSPSKLKTLFRSVFGISIFDFYQQNRLAYALQLIKARELTISEIGFKIGYTNLSKFSRAFKKQFGYLPRQTLIPDRAIS